MNRSRVALIAAVSAAFLGVAGVAFALVDGQDSTPDQIPAPVIGVLAEGIAPSGNRYTISEIDANQGSTVFCFEISTAAASGQGCDAVPDRAGEYQGRPVKPGWALLGTDRFVTMLAPPDVATMRVTAPGSDKDIATVRSIEIDGVGRLLIAAYDGPPVTSETPDAERTVQLLGPDGRVVREATVGDTR